MSDMHTGFDTFKRLMLCCLLMLCCGMSGYAQSTVVQGIEIFFSKAGTAIYPDFHENGPRMNEFEEQVQQYTKLFGAPTAITIRTSSSPDVPDMTNANLSKERSQNVQDWIIRITGCPEEIVLHETISDFWGQISSKISQSDQPWKSKALDIITYCPEFSTHGDEVIEYRKQRLMEIEGGQAWKWISEVVYPELRCCEVTVAFGTSGQQAAPAPVVAPEPEEAREADDAREPEATVEPESAPEPVSVPAAEEVAEPEITPTEVITPESEVESESGIISEPRILPDPKVKAKAAPAKKAPEATSYRKFPFAIRSNLLLPLLNVGLEVPLGNRWSIAADWYYPWLFRNPDHKDCFQALGLQLESRIWLGNKHRRGIANRDWRLTGHSIGLFAMAGYYDLELDYKGLQGEYMLGGIDYMYALRMRNNWRFEFSVGFGYFYSEARPYEVYTPGGQGYREKDVLRAIPFAGPVKGSIALVVPICFGK